MIQMAKLQNNVDDFEDSSDEGKDDQDHEGKCCHKLHAMCSSDRG